MEQRPRSAGPGPSARLIVANVEGTRSVEQPWVPDPQLLLSDRVQRDLRRYATQFPRLRTVICSQLIVSGGILAAVHCWFATVAGRAAWLPMSAGIGILILTLLALRFVFSPRHGRQVFAFDFAQMVNGYLLVLLVVDSIEIGRHPRGWLDFLHLVTLGVLMIFLLLGMVWLLWFYRLSQKVRQFREQSTQDPREKWEISPWAHFQAPLAEDELDVPAGWDSAGPPEPDRQP